MEDGDPIIFPEEAWTEPSNCAGGLEYDNHQEELSGAGEGLSHATEGVPEGSQSLLRPAGTGPQGVLRCSSSGSPVPMLVETSRDVSFLFSPRIMPLPLSPQWVGIQVT